MGILHDNIPSYYGFIKASANLCQNSPINLVTVKIKTLEIETGNSTFGITYPVFYRDRFKYLSDQFTYADNGITLPENKITCSDSTFSLPGCKFKTTENGFTSTDNKLTCADGTITLPGCDFTITENQFTPAGNKFTCTGGTYTLSENRMYAGKIRKSARNALFIIKRKNRKRN